MKRDLLIALGSATLTVVLTLLGWSYAFGRNQVTRADLTTIDNSINTQMAEIRGYFVDHLRDHAEEEREVAP